jgi:hypothetical protein
MEKLGRVAEAPPLLLPGCVFMKGDVGAGSVVYFSLYTWRLEMKLTLGPLPSSQRAARFPAPHLA